MTAELPDRTCAVEGCSDPAVARLFDHRGEPGLRCEGCLKFDLERDREVRADGGTVPSRYNHHRHLRAIRDRARATARKLRAREGE